MKHDQKSLYREKLLQAPHWAFDIEPDTAKVAAWFAGVTHDRHGSWPNTVEVVCPNPCVADYLIENYLVPIVRMIQREYRGSPRVIIRPERCTGRQVYNWSYKCGTTSTQAGLTDEQKSQVVGWMAYWRTGKLTEADLAAWHDGAAPPN